MRRIFGSNNVLTGSSTSNSLASDSLPSPVPSTSSSHHSNQPFPTSGSSHSLNDRQLQSGYESNNSTVDDEPQRRGWFGAALAGGSSASSNTGAGSSGPPRDGTVGQQQGPSRGQDQVESLSLPFGRSPRSPQGRGSPVGAVSTAQHSRTTSRAAPRPPVGGNGVTPRPFSPPVPDRVISPAPSSSSKDAMLVELLSGQAVVEARDYKILDWDEMEEVKKDHALLATRIATLNRALALETRLRDSAAKLVRLSAPASATPPTLPSANSKPRVTREQAEAQVAAANAKMDSISAEMYKLGWRESELRTRLLQHTAGVLGLAIRRKEEEEASGAGQTPLQGNTAAFSSNGSARNSHQSEPLSPGGRFEGRHFFAGNKDAIVPTGRQGAISPISSPRLGSSNGGFSHFDEGSAAKVRELEAKVDQLEAQLRSVRDDHEEQQRSRSVEANRGHQEELERIRDELNQSRRRESGSREEATISRRDAIDTKRELSELRREAEVLRDDLRFAKDAGEKAKREAEEARKEVETVKGSGGDAQREVEEARQETDQIKLDLAQAEHREAEAEARLVEMEHELERVRDEGDDEIRRLEAELAALDEAKDVETHGERQAKEDLASARQERSRITQVIGDVLRRHRNNQPALRDLPPFDDQTDHADLSSYLSTSLDSHFDRLTAHSASLSAELDSARSAHETTRSGLESDLSTAEASHNHLRSEIDAHRSAREALQRDHEELQTRVRSQDQQLADLPTLQTDLARAREEETRLKQELSTVKTALQGLEAQLAELKSGQEAMSSRAHEAEREATEKRDEAVRLGRQLKDLQEKIDVSATQEVNMLERLNDLTESLEKTRGEKRQLDALLPTLQSQVRSLEGEKATLTQNLVAAQQETTRLAARPDYSAKLAAVEEELRDARDSLQDTLEELEDAKAREAKTRAGLLEELSSVQADLSSTRTKLRQAERKNGAAVK